MLIDLHAHVTDDVPAQLARARAAGVERTVLLTTRVHPETPATLPQLRAELGRLNGVIAGAPSAIADHQRARAEQRNALDAHPDTTWGFASVPLDLPADEAVEWLAARLSEPRIVGIGELTPPPGRADLIEPLLACSADHGGLVPAEKYVRPGQGLFEARPTTSPTGGSPHRHR